MNERIRELWTQVCLDEMPELDETCMTLSRQRKFAELIVKQCIQELAASGRCDPYTGDLFDCEYNKCLSTQLTMLAECFGVEE